MAALPAAREQEETMDIRALRYFVEIAKQRSFTAAAERCFVTQPTLSRRIAELEDELGHPLFVRSTRRVELTEKGLLLFHQAQTILSLVERTERDIKGESDIAGDLLISAAEVPAFETVARALVKFRKAHPAVRVHLASANGHRALLDLREGLANFALLNVPVDLAGLEYIELPVRARWGILTHRDGPFAGLKTVSPEVLMARADTPLYTSTQRLTESRLSGWLGFPSERLQIAGTYTLLNNMRSMVRHGCSCLALGGIVHEDDVVRFLPLEPALTTYSVFAWPATMVKDRIGEAFLEVLRAQAAEEAAAIAAAENGAAANGD